MNKTWLTILLFTCAALPAASQTLFTYGNYKADAADFVRAFNKNNQQSPESKAKAMREYLDLYINSRLKIREALDRRFDTLPQITSEVDNLRSQVIENYMSDPETINRLTKEAFQRSQKDIHAAHIFISFNNSVGLTDTVSAKKKLAEITSRLAKGEDFMTVASQLSDDPSASINKGDLDYITVFTLPYEFENVIYSTAPGKNSTVYTSKAGYHIFRNLGERKALGKVRLQQILLAYPPGVDEAGKKGMARLADSLYQRLLKGEDFGKLAAGFSNDYVSASAGGNVPDISVGQFDPVFEKTIWALPSNGAVSKPFITSHGIHIVKRISLVPVVTNPADKQNTEVLQQKVKGDDRWKTSKDFIYAAVIKKQPIQRAAYSDDALWAISDSLFDGKSAGIGRSMTTESPLFGIGDTRYTVAEWIAYGQQNRYKSDRSGLKPYPALMDEFVKSSMYQYYRDHLEDFNEEFRNQMAEFRDGNLFFEIMQQEVWNKTQSDSMALLALYEKNKGKYNWKQSADAVIFFCSDAATAKTLNDQLKKNGQGWKKSVEKLSEKVVADSARYEWSQLPGLGKNIPKAGTLTILTINPTDNTTSFAYIIAVHPQPAGRTFTEAKGLVMNDYQTWLEEEWVKQLKKEYPVVVDEKEVEKLSK
ncbi:MAG TPA: peptidylprolyl isomerase [Chitinophagaceae bacterium]|nr:peptidylprolyl isomerase [Chitinophagaceae bacterium]